MDIAPPSGRSECDVLVVEDDVIQSEEIVWFFARGGLAVQAAHDGSSALCLATTLRPRVALLDYNLPDTTGIELAEQLRASLPDTVIIIMSGRIDGLPEAALEKIGIAAFVNKPIPLRLLRQAVLRLVQPRPANDESPPLQKDWLAASLVAQPS